MFRLNSIVLIQGACCDLVDTRGRRPVDVAWNNLCLPDICANGCTCTAAQLIPPLPLASVLYKPGIAVSSGWDVHEPASLKEVSDPSCSIDVRPSNITYEELLRDYLLLGRPVLLRGFRWPALKTWRRQSFLSSYGDLKVLGASVYACLC